MMSSATPRGNASLAQQPSCSNQIGRPNEALLPARLHEHEVGLVNALLVNPGAMRNEPRCRTVDTALPDGGDVTIHLPHAFAGHRLGADQIGKLCEESKALCGVVRSVPPRHSK